MRTRTLQTAGIATGGALFLIAMIALPALGQQDRPRGARPDEVPQIPVRFQATVFKVNLDKQHLAEIDAQALAAAGGSAPEMAKTLSDFGKVEALYRVDQVLSLTGRGRNRIIITRDTPYTSGIGMSQSGQVTTSISRQSVGASFEIYGGYASKAGGAPLSVQIQVELSAITDSSIEVGPKVSSPVFWKVEQAYSAPTEYGAPIVLLTVDGAATTGHDNPIAFVTLIKLTEPGSS